MTVIYGLTEELQHWIEQHGVEFSGRDAQFIGIKRGDKFTGAVMYENFTEFNCDAHIFTDGQRQWATRPVLTALFAYPFLQCGLARLTGRIPSSNVPALINALKLGFKFEGRMLGAQYPDDEIILGMTRAECPWLPAKE